MSVGGGAERVRQRERELRGHKIALSSAKRYGRTLELFQELPAWK